MVIPGLKPGMTALDGGNAEGSLALPVQRYLLTGQSYIVAIGRRLCWVNS